MRRLSRFILSFALALPLASSALTLQDLNAGASFTNVARTTVYLADMNDFAAMNEVYSRYIVDPPPARATVQVARLPRDVKIEVDAIAVLA